MTRRRVLMLLAAAAAVGLLGGCDTLFGPGGDPALIEIRASRDTIDALGDTLVLEAVVRNDEGEILPDADVSWHSRVPEVAQVDGRGQVVALRNGRATVFARSGRAADSLLLTIDAPTLCPILGDIAIPGTLSGALAPGDCNLEGSLLDVWELVLDEDQLVSIDLVSTEFNPVLFMFNGSGGAPVFNDDGGPGMNARIRGNLRAGTYYIYVTSLTIGDAGGYELSTAVGPFPSPCPASAAIGLPDTVTASVDGSGCVYQDFYIDVWRMDLPHDTTLVIQAMSDDIDAQVVVTDTLGIQLDRSTVGPGTDAWLEIFLPAGSYDVWVGDSERVRRSGEYTLTTRPGSGLEHCGTMGSMAHGETVDGQLTTADCFLYIGRGEGWDLTVSETVDVEITAHAPGLFPVIAVANDEYEIIRVFRQGADLAQGQTGLQPGSYTVWTLGTGARFGEYALTVAPADQLPDCPAVGAVTLGATVSGEIAGSDCRLAEQRLADPWEIQVDTTSRVQVRLESDEVDVLLMVSDTAGRRIGFNDDSGGTRNSRLTLELDPGTYLLWATSYHPGAQGPYHLTYAPGESASAGAMGPGAAASQGAKPAPQSGDASLLTPGLDSTRAGLPEWRDGPGGGDGGPRP